MTLRELTRRVEKLRPDRISVLARMPDGTEKEMDVPQFLESGGDFIKCIRGTDLNDARLILSTFVSVIE